MWISEFIVCWSLPIMVPVTAARGRSHIASSGLTCRGLVQMAFWSKRIRFGVPRRVIGADFGARARAGDGVGGVVRLRRRRQRGGGCGVGHFALRGAALGGAKPDSGEQERGGEAEGGAKSGGCHRHRRVRASLLPPLLEATIGEWLEVRWDSGQERCCGVVPPPPRGVFWS